MNTITDACKNAVSDSRGGRAARFLLSVAISCCLVLSMFPLPTYAADVERITFRYASGGTMLTSDRDYEAVCFYSDGYFADSSFRYNPNLATMSLALSMSAFGSTEGDGSYSDNSKNVKQLMLDMGMDAGSIGTNEWFVQKPTRDSIGVAAGSKHIVADGKEYTLVVFAIRGAGYEAEWASNFTFGAEGPHKGFSEAKNSVLEYIKQYISEQGITGPVKLWITGYSRAGAVANLVGGEIDDWADAAAPLEDPDFNYEQAEEDEAICFRAISDDTMSEAGSFAISGAADYEGVTFGKEDVYVYCFEPPAGRLLSEEKDGTNDKDVISGGDGTSGEDAVSGGDGLNGEGHENPDGHAKDDHALSVEDDRKAYGNIFNIINPEDLVVYSVPEAYGFGRYGVDLCFPAKGVTEVYDEMEERVSEIYNDLGSRGEYIDTDFRMKKLDIRWKTARRGKRITVTPELVINDVANQMSQGAFLLDYMTFFANDIVGSREKYSEVYEDELRELLGTVFGGTEEQNELFVKSLSTKAQNNIGTAARTYRNYMLLRLLKGSADKDMLWQMVSDWLNASMADAGYEDYSAETVDRAGKDLGPLMSTLVVRRINYFVTLIENADIIVQAHYPELCFAWLTSMDDNYFNAAEPVFYGGSFDKMMSVFAEQAGEYEYGQDDGTAGEEKNTGHAEQAGEGGGEVAAGQAGEGKNAGPAEHAGEGKEAAGQAGEDKNAGSEEKASERSDVPAVKKADDSGSMMAGSIDKKTVAATGQGMFSKLMQKATLGRRQAAQGILYRIFRKKEYIQNTVFSRILSLGTAKQIEGGLT